MDNYLSIKENKSKVQTSKSNKIETKLRNIQPKDFHKLNENQKEEYFLQQYEFNLDLKQQQTILEKKIKQMNTQITIADKEYSKATKGQKVRIDREKLEKIEEVQEENNRLQYKLQRYQEQHNVTEKQKELVDQQVSNQDSKKVQDLKALLERLKEINQRQSTELSSIQSAFQRKTNSNEEKNHQAVQLVGLQNKYEQLVIYNEHKQNELDKLQNNMIQSNSQINQARKDNDDLQSHVDTCQIKMKHIQQLKEDLKREQQQYEKQEKLIAQISPDFQQAVLKADKKVQHEQLEYKYKELQKNNKILSDDLVKIKTQISVNQEQIENNKKKIQKKNLEINTINAKIDKDIRVSQNVIHTANTVPNQQEVNIIRRQLGLDHTVASAAKEAIWQDHEIISRNHNNDNNIQHLQKETDNIIVEKAQITQHLENSLKDLKNYMKLENTTKLQYDEYGSELKNEIRQLKKKFKELSKIADKKGHKNIQEKEIYQQDGVKYDGNISVFSVDSFEPEQPNDNILDLYANNCKIITDKKTIQQITQRISYEDMNLFLTFDFFDHNSQHTQILPGSNVNFHFQCSYNIVCDQFFLAYIQKEFINVELYCGENNKTELLGVGRVNLAQLYTDDNNVSKVIDGDIVITNKKLNVQVAMVEIRTRLRFPILEQIRFDEIQPEFKEEDNYNNLIFEIIRLQGVKKEQLPTFVYYQLLDEDFTTEYVNKYQYKYRKIHKINQDVVKDWRFKNNNKIDNLIELVVFNEVQQDEENQEDEVLGYSYVNLNELFGQTQAIIKQIELKESNNQQNNTNMTLQIKIYWDTVMIEEFDNVILNIFDANVFNTIVNAIKSRLFTLENAFAVFCRSEEKVTTNKTEISKQDFEDTVNGTFQLHLSNMQINQFWSDLQKYLNKTPFDQAQFELLFRQFLLDNQYLQTLQNEAGYDQEDLKSQEQQKGKKIQDYLIEQYQLNGISHLWDFLDVKDQGYITIADTMELFKKLKKDRIEISKSSIEMFFHDLGTNNSIDYFKLEDYLKIKISTLQLSNINPIAKEILINIRNNGYTYQKLYNDIDINRDNLLSKLELINFIQKKLKLEFTKADILELFSEIDLDNNENVNLQEFINYLRSQAKNDKENDHYQLTKGDLTECKSEVINNLAIQLAKYLIDNNKNFNDIHNIIDINIDGEITRQELFYALKNIFQIQIEKKVFDKIFNLMDLNKNNIISMGEFVKCLEAKVKIFQSQLNSQKKQDQFKKKITQILQNSQEKMLQQFTLFQSHKNQGFINIRNFQEILQSSCPQLSQDEVNIITNVYCDQNNMQEMNYKTFIYKVKHEKFDEIEFNSQQIQKIENTQVQDNSLKIIRRIRQKIKEKGLRLKSVFDKIDKNKNKQIDLKEMITALHQMEFQKEFTNNELAQVFHFINYDNNESIDITEFIQAMS